MKIKIKKILAAILSIGMLFSLCACGGKDKTESKDEPPKISKEEYENMTADDLFNALVESSDRVTVDEYVDIIETFQYADIIDGAFVTRYSITNDVLSKIGSEYPSNKRPLSSEWVPLLITHKSPQVRGYAFQSASPVYDHPEFVTAVKEVMKNEKEPYVLWNIVSSFPTSLVANDSEIAAFVQDMTEHENQQIQSAAKRKLERVAEKNQ